MIRFAFLFFAFLLVTCTTYDNAIVYHKNFQSGTHPLLRFDGYYTDTLGPKPNPNSAMAEIYVEKPYFFYANGSSYSCDNYIGTFKLLNVNALDGSWGNYIIKEDSIRLEKFQLIGSNYERIIMKGIISKDQIRWTSRQDRNESAKPVDYTAFFTPHATKPDSTKNFTRTLKKYNK